MIPQTPQVTGLYANLCAFVLDFIARQKMAGTHLTYGYFTQLPILPPSSYEKDCPWEYGERLDSWVRARVIELTYTSYGMAAFARDHGDSGQPFLWDEERRFWIRAELDAAYFHLYNVSRNNVDYILESFKALKNINPDGFTRTKKAILEIYDAIAEAIDKQKPYRTVLDPPPGHGPRHAPL
jgi:hypothetical protein